MTMDANDLRELANALEPMAKAPRFEDFDVPAFCAWVRACADAQPVGYVTANGLRSLRQDDATVLLYAHDYLIRPDHVALYTHPAPAAPQAEPKREPLSDERINEIGEPFGYFTYGDAQGDKRRLFVRAIESSHGIGYGKAIEGGPSELRSCTCHPDDNPPVPCAQKYALNECRATRSGPDEAQIEARDALLDFISENGTASEGVQHYLDRYVRAALAAKE